MNWAIFLLLLCSIERHSYLVEHVDIIELNHVVRIDYGTLKILDQIILWKYDRFYNKYRVYDYEVIDGRENLTDAEYRQKEREVVGEWLKSRPHYRGELPKYVPEFIGCLEVPKYDYRRKKYVTIWFFMNVPYYVYGNTFVETWTDYDVEAKYRREYDARTKRMFFIRYLKYRQELEK